MENNFNGQDYEPENVQNSYDENNSLYSDYTQSTSYQEYSDNAVTGVDKAPKKRKGVLIGGICAGVVGVAVGGSAIAYATSDYVKNQVKLATLNDQEYYSWVIEKNSEDTAENISEAYEEYLERLEEGTGSSLSVVYNPSDDAKDLILENERELESTGYADSIIDVVKNLQELELGVDVSMNKDSYITSFFAGVNGENAVTFDVGQNDSSLFMRIPEYSEQWLSYDMSQVMSGEEAELYNKLSEFTSNPEEIISPDQLSDMVKRYTGILGDSFKDVKCYKDQKVDIAGTSVEYTVLTTDITPDVALDIMKEYLETAQEDETLEEILTDKLEVCSSEEYEETIADTLRYIEEMSEEDYSSDDAIAAAIFVDARGDIRGCQFYIDDSVELICAVGMDGDNIVGEISVSVDDESVLSVVVNAEESDGLYNGAIKMEAEDEGEIAEIKFANLEIVDEEKGYVNGNLRISIPDAPNIDLVLKSDGKSQVITYEIKVERYDLGDISVKISETDAKSISFDDAIDITDSDFDVNDYLNEDDLTKFIKDIGTKIGLDEDLAEALAAEILVGSAYSNDDYDDDDWDYYDDEDWEDWDDEDWEDWDDEDWDEFYNDSFDDEDWADWEEL